MVQPLSAFWTLSWTLTRVIPELAAELFLLEPSIVSCLLPFLVGPPIQSEAQGHTAVNI